MVILLVKSVLLFTNSCAAARAGRDSGGHLRLGGSQCSPDTGAGYRGPQQDRIHSTEQKIIEENSREENRTGQDRRYRKRKEQK